MIKFFNSQKRLREWFEKNYNKAEEIFIGFHKVGSGKKGVTYKQALDEALCFGWIDGIRYSIDDKSYKIRFTPRRKTSKWSNVNIHRAEELLNSGRMNPAGVDAFKNHKSEKRIKYSYEEKIKKLSSEYEKIFKANGKAWKYFQRQPPYYKKTSAFWVMSAKKEETRNRRLKILINDSENQKRIDLLNPKAKSESR